MSAQGFTKSMAWVALGEPAPLFASLFHEIFLTTYCRTREDLPSSQRGNGEHGASVFCTELRFCFLYREDAKKISLVDWFRALLVHFSVVLAMRAAFCYGRYDSGPHGDGAFQFM